MTSTSALGTEQRKIVRAAILAGACCTIAFAAGYILLPRSVEFPYELSERIAFALRADLFVLLWVLLGVRLVSRGRFHSPDDIGGAAAGPPSPRLAVPVAFLQNTVEQALVAIGAHLALSTMLIGDELALIPVAVALFCIGRVTFLLGYRKGAGGRAFGMVTTALPTAAGYVLAVVLLFAR
jgi:hypothetical protein